MLNVFYPLAKPLMMTLDPEAAHNIGLKVLRSPLGRASYPKADPSLNVQLFDRVFDCPLGVAAGFDKNAESVDSLLGMGFGFVEAGTVTPRPQVGNETPRIFRHRASGSVINRMGFPNKGMDVFATNMEKFRKKGMNANGIVGINIGKNKDTESAVDDYKLLIKQFGKDADYLCVNISSPNTPGLRDLQSKENLVPFLGELVSHKIINCPRTPLLVKFSPDMTDEQVEDVAASVRAINIDGLVLCNTTLDRPESLPRSFREQPGGLSGPHCEEKSKEVVKTFYKLTEGKLPIIGVGGIDSAETAYAKIKAGASLVQLYTSFIYQGPAVVGRIRKGLVRLMNEDGFSSISEAIGKDT